MPAQVFGTDAVVLQLNQAFRGTAPSNSDFNTQKASVVAQGESAFAITFGAAYAPANAQSAADFVPLANKILANLNLTAPTIAAVKAADLAAALPQLLFFYQGAIGQVVLNLTNILRDLEGDANWGVAAAKFNQQELVAHHYSSSASSTAELPIPGFGLEVMLTAGAASVNEGGAVTFTVNGTANTEYGYKIEGVQAADISGSTVGFVTTNANGVATFSVLTVADRLTEGAETMKVSILNHDATTVTIVDTSLDNIAPVITAAATLAAQEDVAATFNVSTSDVEGDAVTVTATAANGTVVNTGSGTFTYTGNANFNGADTITITATDALGAASTRTVAVTVAAVNDAPVITAPATLAATEELAALFSVSAADVDGDTVTLTATAANGTVVNNGNGTFTYTGNVNFAGSDTITVIANDGTVNTTQTIAVTVANVNDAPVAAAATAAAAEAGPVVTGQLVATDADAGDTLTYTLNAAVAGLTLNANGSYSFNPSQNPAAQALVYSSAPLSIAANYTVTDAAGATSQSTLTITVAPTPLTYTLTKTGASVEEGSSQVYTVTASEALTTAANVIFTLLPGDGTAANAGTSNTNTVDFATGSFNPVTATIGVGQTTAAFTVNPSSDAITELPESFTVQAVVAGQTYTLGGTAVDATTTGGVGQTFTLTTGVDTIPGLIGSANSAGTDGNDVVIGTLGGASPTITALDAINGGLGTNEFRILDLTGGSALPGGLTVSNMQTITARSVGAMTLDTTAWAGVTSLSSTTSVAASLTAAATTAVSVTGATGLVTIDGGSSQTVTTAGTGVTLGATTVATGAISVTHTKQAATTIAIDGGSTVSVTSAGSTGGAITVGQGGAATDLPTGAVTVTSSNTAVAGVDATLAAITVTGGASVTATQAATSTLAAADTVGSTVTQGNVTITGGTATTTVTANQTVSKAEVLAVTGVAGVTESASVKFSALTAGQTLIMGGLTFTASGAVTAAEAAAAFANLIIGTIPVAGDLQGGGAASKGTYTGAFTGWTSGAASGDTVVFTSTTATTNVADLANTGTGTAVVTTTAGSAATKAVTGVLGVANGTVVIDDNATAASITTVTVDGYGNASTIGATNTLSKLATLSLANSGSTGTAGETDATMSVDAVGVTSLNLSVNAINGAVTLDGGGASVKTLSLTNTGAGSTFALTAAAVETLTVAGTQAASLTADLAALKTVSVSGSAGLTLVAAAADTITSVNTTATTGTVTTTIEGARATYTGGAGKDVVTLVTDTALTKAIDLGAGDDTLTFGVAVTGSTSTVKGGDGTDTLSMTAATADGLDGALQSFYSGFERLTINNASGDDDNVLDTLTLDLVNLGFTNYVTTTGTVADTTTPAKSDVLVLNKMASGGTVVLTANGLITVGVADAATGTADVLNAVISNAATLNAGTLTAANVETVNITSTDTTTPFTAAHTLILTADKATSVTVAGNASLTLTMTGSTKATSIDGSAMTGGLTVTSLNTTSATTIKGGSGNDVLTAATGTTADVLNGGAGDDTLVANAGLSTLIGGAGNDLFVIGTASLNSSSYSTISDFTAGDLIKFTGADSFQASKVTLGDTAVFQDYANAAINAIGANDVAWFQFAGNTYMVMDVGNSAAFINGTDLIVRLNGVIDLTNASFNDSQDTIGL